MNYEPLTDEKALKMLLEAYVKMVELKSCEPGEKSHMLAHHTEFLKKQINVILKRIGAI